MVVVLHTEETELQLRSTSHPNARQGILARARSSEVSHLQGWSEMNMLLRIPETQALAASTVLTSEKTALESRDGG